MADFTSPTLDATPGTAAPTRSLCAVDKPGCSRIDPISPWPSTQLYIGSETTGLSVGRTLVPQVGGYATGYHHRTRRSVSKNPVFVAVSLGRWPKNARGASRILRQSRLANCQVSSWLCHYFDPTTVLEAGEKSAQVHHGRAPPSLVDNRALVSVLAGCVLQVVVPSRRFTTLLASWS